MDQVKATMESGFERCWIFLDSVAFKRSISGLGFEVQAAALVA
jgi:hypothetical protein